MVLSSCVFSQVNLEEPTKNDPWTKSTWSDLYKCHYSSDILTGVKTKLWCNNWQAIASLWPHYNIARVNLLLQKKWVGPKQERCPLTQNYKSVSKYGSKSPKNVLAPLTYVIKFASDLTCMDLGKRGIPQCISPLPARAAAMSGCRSMNSRSSWVHSCILRAEKQL